MLNIGYLVKLIYIILDVGIKLSISTGVMFNPVYQERTTPTHDFVQSGTHRYIPNFEYSETEWTKTFTLVKTRR